LDQALFNIQNEITGAVLEIGNGHVGRRGKFIPPSAPQVLLWKYLDRRPEVLPDVCADILDMPFSQNNFDAVVCLEVFEYVPKYIEAFREIHRVLKPQGKLILSIPFLHRMDSPGDYYRFTESGLRQALESSGFSVEKMVPQGAALAVAASVIKHALRMINQRIPRWLLSVLAFVPLEAMVYLDSLSAKVVADLRTFSTGYLTIAVKKL
jgi:SAM-dependent methyltransferase